MKTTYQNLIQAGVGAALILNRSFLGEPEGVRGLVYEVYEIVPGEPGVSVITENGVDLSGFSKDDIERFTTFIGAVELDYAFISVGYLAEDLRAGEFNQALQELRLLGMATNF